MANLYLPIAKNEVRLWTSSFRNHRGLFFGILIAFMGIYAFLLVPLVLNAFYAPIHNLLMGFGSGLPIFIYFIFSLIILYIFLLSITFPLSSMLQSTNDLSGQLEILLGSPIKKQDILFGKFIGRIPTYLIMIFLVVLTYYGREIILAMRIWPKRSANWYPKFGIILVVKNCLVRMIII